MRLTASLVVHDWHWPELESCLASLSLAMVKALPDASAEHGHLTILYNGQQPLPDAAGDKVAAQFGFPFTLVSDAPNLGYGGTNNLAIRPLQEQASPGDYHLVINPDTTLAANTLQILLKQATMVADCGLLSPKLLDENNTPQWGNKRYPSAMVLLARLLPALLRWPPLAQLNKHYQYQDLANTTQATEVELCSGCFLLASVECWLKLQGFDDQYFMYFEDFDLSLRALDAGFRNVYLPSAVVYHQGGYTGRKNWLHKKWFIASAWQFFSRHGFRVWQVGVKNKST
ncbi:glycosyltransferase family 2 protein [Halioxenophilus sp. WMMB6]|uniref:glycosyltransferase family 2 protein n=1 Tax=Halioxenophilus sp. WMMB6 TaxID=3073815 RepID=UPI00295F3191|nr:glycosyltransferase family 2 protein [Halioxenophilus sp. WMMB6]